jgi:Ala-tRNA(Pro) deacylase
VDLEQLREASAAQSVEIASEADFRDKFSGCEVGAIPPFGNLYGLKTYVAESLREDEEIAFSAGTHSELIRLSYTDFEKLVLPCEFAAFAHV